MRDLAKNIRLPSIDDLFSTEEERQDAKLEKIQILPLSELHPFEGHPFQVRNDEEMDKMVDSVKEYGVMTPAIVRPRRDGGYEIVAGHRRCHASRRAGVDTMPCIVRDMDDDTAIILMVDSNCQREHILPSEKAKAYLDCFYHIVSRGNAEGKLASFPLTGRCSIQRDCKLPPIRTYQKTLPQDTVYYLGIAADEPIRLARLKANQTSLLAKYNLTEKDAQAMCQAEGLLSPLYAFTGRGGCWFCPNASMRELRHLYNAHPDLWQLLLELQDAPNKATERFNRSYTLHDLDLRFCLEGEQLSFFTYEER